MAFYSLRPSDAYMRQYPIICSDNSLAPTKRQASIWVNAGILLIRTLGTNLSEILKQNSYIFPEENKFENVVCEMASSLSRLSGVMLPKRPW